MGIKDSCTGNHVGLADKQLLSHYNAGCKDDLTRRAKADYSSRYYHDNKPPSKALKTSAGKPGPRTAGGVSGMGATIRTPEPATAQQSTRIPAELATPKPAAPIAEDKVPSLGAARRLRSLVRIGHTLTSLAGELGFSADAVFALLLYPEDHIKTSTHASIAELYKRRRYEALQGATPIADKMVALAKKLGWPTPFAFDNIDTDPAPADDIKAQQKQFALQGKIDRIQGKLDAQTRLVVKLERQAESTAPATPLVADLREQITAAHTEIEELRAGIRRVLTADAQQGDGRHRAPDDLNDTTPTQWVMLDSEALLSALQEVTR